MFRQSEYTGTMMCFCSWRLHHATTGFGQRCTDTAVLYGNTQGGSFRRNHVYFCLSRVYTNAMSVTRWYKFTEDTADLGKDSSGNQKDLTNFGVTSVTDATYGKVAYFDESSYLMLDKEDIPVNMTLGNSRAMSLWVKPDRDGHTGGLITYGNKFNSIANGFRYAMFFSGGDNGVIYILYFNISSTISPSDLITTDAWNHVTAVFHDAGDLSQIYINGTLAVSAQKGLSTSPNYPLYVGYYGEERRNHFKGCMTDMRFYDDALDAAAILALYSDGPATPPTLESVMYTHVADLTWDAVSGASSYRITAGDESVAGEVVVDLSASGTSATVPNLAPGNSYEFKLYTDLDPLVSAASTTDSTPAVDATSVESLLSRFSNSLVLLSIFSSAALGDINSSLRDALSTGEVVGTKLGETIFVQDSDTLTIPSVGAAVLTSFDASAGSSQTATVTLSDSSSVVVTYDETANEIAANGSIVAVGSHAVVGGYKVSVREI